MLHPDLVVRKSTISGKGLFAKRFIPKGTIIWKLQGEKYKTYTQSQYKKLSNSYKKTLKKYAYQDNKGNIIYVIGKAKFWNHSCDPNTVPINENLSIDITVRDLKPNEEATYDYGLIYSKKEKALRCRCGSKICRKIVRRLSNNSKARERLRKLAKEASKEYSQNRQPYFKTQKYIKAYR